MAAALILLSVARLMAAPIVTAAGQAVASPQDPASATADSVLDGVFTPEQAGSGQQIFQKVCSSCHTLAEHTGRKFQTKWIDTTVGDMFGLISSTMPEGNPGSLAAEEYASVIAYFLKETGYPEGSHRLPAQIDDLMKIRIESLPER